MTTHDKIKDLKKWVDIDINSPTTNKKITNIINNDLQKDSPTILHELNGKYSPFKEKMSYLGKTHIDLLKSDKDIRTTMTVLKAVCKFKKLKK
jgi:hypothetical protein